MVLLATALEVNFILLICLIVLFRYQMNLELAMVIVVLSNY